MPGHLICFVCGSPGAITCLRIRQHDKEPYFPFLGHHDPPKGSRTPTSDGLVDSCRVCYMFLVQQWESYERSKTPAVKRLYWLKRSDNGNFTGAEMRLQGEYIAQVMGLQYPPGFDDGGSPDNSNLPPDSEYLSSSSNMRGAKYQNSESQAFKSSTNEITSKDPKDSALDLTTPKKDHERYHRSERSHKHVDEKVTTCYICGQQQSFSPSNVLNVLPQSKNEPFFPILEKISPAYGAEMMTTNGQINSCSHCKNTLFQQWQAFEMSGTPIHFRNFKIPKEVLSDRHLEKLNKSPEKSKVKMEDKKDPEEDRSMFYCYICGTSYISDHVRLLNTLPAKQSSPPSMFFPFVRELKRPPHAEPLRSDGSVIVCIQCYGHLSYQWEIQEVEGVPVYHRQYSLHFLSNKCPSPPKPVVPSTTVNPSPDESIQPLNIQISTPSSPMQSNATPGSAHQSTQGLLAIAPPVEIPQPPPTSSRESSCSPIKTIDSHESRHLPSETSVTGTVPHPLTTVTEIPKKVCYLCAEQCIIYKMKQVKSYPARHEAKHNSQTEPFFPFLTNVTPPHGADMLSADGTVIVCKLCYFSLLKQWAEYELSSNPADSNRWLRKYVQPTHVCYVCNATGDRRIMRTIATEKFHFLREHKPPPDALVIDDGQRVVVCKTCAYGLMKQFVEFERLGVPVQLRKFNWVHKAHTDEDEKDSQESIRKVTERWASASGIPTPGNSSHTSDQGHPGVKPPPLNMLSPAGSKLQRNTATVSPLHHVTSPTNGVNSIGANAALNASRTSSFAAALRKLANQAKDPPEEAVSKSTSSSSPRETVAVSKAGPPPLVYTSTNLTSPPVVTIAPTQSHPSLLASESRPSLDRLHSSSSLFEAVPSKTDRPHSSASRDDDRASSRDNLSQSNRRITPHSTPGTVSPMSGREEPTARGFQPYRPGEDLRPPLPVTMDQAVAAAAAAYSYPAAFLPPHAFPHPAFRFDDPLILERYRMMQSPYSMYPQGMLPHPSLHPLLSSGARYPPELFPQQFGGYSQHSRMSEHRSPSLLSERQRLEEEKQRELEREKEKEREKERELILQRERQRALEREAEKQRERDRSQREQERREATERARARDDSLCKSSKFSSVIQGSQKGLGIADRYPRVSASASSLPLRRDEPRRNSRDDHLTSSSSSTSGAGGSNSSKNGRPSSQKGYSEDSDKRFSLVAPLREGERSRPPPLISPRSREEGVSRTHKSGESGLFRPFDNKQLANGFEGTDKRGKNCDRDYDRDKIYTYRSDSEGKKYSQDHQRLSASSDQRLSSDRDRKESHNSDLSHKFGSQSSAFQSLSNHMSLGEAGSSVFPLSRSLSQSEPSELTSPTAPFPIPLNVPTYSAASLPNSTLLSSTRKSQNSTASLSSSKSSSKDFLFHSISSSCVSKLDLEAKKMTESRDGTVVPAYCSDSECDYDSDASAERKLIISSGPPLKLDTSPKKIKLLSQLGLTTHSQRKEADFEKLRKHRRCLREQSVSPVSVEDCPLAASPLKTRYSPEDLCREPDYASKCHFLSENLRLGTVSPETRRAKEQIWKTIQAEKRRRLNPSDESDSKLEQTVGVKRKFDEIEEDSIKTKHHLLSASFDGHSRELLTRSLSGGSGSSHKVWDSKGVCERPHSAMFEPSRGDLAKNFVQEFHESVLKTTRQKELSRSLVEGQSRESRAGDQAFLHPHTLPYRLPGLEAWLGVDVVMEAYHRHQQVERMERDTLLERNHHLTTENTELKKTAELLNKRMEELYSNKRHLEELRVYNQERIDLLKMSIKKLK